MTATLSTLPLDIILSISAFLSNPLDVLSLSQTCRSAFLASRAWASYWSKLVPAAHLSRLAPWHSYSLGELRDAHIRYATTHRRWESPLPTFNSPLRLPPPPGPKDSVAFPPYWRFIRGTRWAWSLRRSTGEVSFCDLRSGLVIRKWSARGEVVDAFIESRSPNECLLCHWKANQGDNMNEFKIVATSVTFEQENLFSPITLSFKTIQRISIGQGISLSDNSSRDPMVLWRDYLIGSYVGAQHGTHGLFLWSMTEKSIFYFEMEFYPHCTKVVDDVLFVRLDSTRRHTIHLPSLVISTPLLGGSLSLTENAVGALLPKSILGSNQAASPYLLGQTNIHPIPAYPPTHPTCCFIIKRGMTESLTPSRGVEWEVFEMEVDLRTPGPIEIFSRVSWQYHEQRPTYSSHDSDDDLFLYLPSPCGSRPDYGLPSVRFFRGGKPDTWRVVRFRGVDKMQMDDGLRVDTDAGYVIIWGREPWRGSTRECCFIWWFVDMRIPGNTVYTRTKELISSWSRGLLRRF